MRHQQKRAFYVYLRKQLVWPSLELALKSPATQEPAKKEAPTTLPNQDLLKLLVYWPSLVFPLHFLKGAQAQEPAKERNPKPTP